ncbi:MAG: zf-HC2 domain-containing protein [Nitrospirae bacterium]|nr:zf-HC2 domain-containing protein [Nitrospirota bacterium]
MKQCHTVRKLLSAYMDGGIEGASRDHMEEHLSQCSECAQQLQQLRALSQRLSCMSQVRAPDDFLGSLRQRMEQPQRHGMKMPVKIPLGFAALAMLVVIAFSVLHREPQMQHILDDVKLPPPGLESKAYVKTEDKTESHSEGKAEGNLKSGVAEETSRDALTKTESQPPAPTRLAKERRADMSAPATSDKPMSPPAPPVTTAEAPAGVALPRAVPAPAPTVVTPTIVPSADAPTMAPLEAEAPATLQKATVPARLETSTAPPPPALKPNGQGVAIGSFNTNSTGESSDEKIKQQQRITLIVSVESDDSDQDSFKDSKKSRAVRDSGDLKEEVSKSHRESKKAVTPVFDRVVALIRDNGGRVVSDNAARQRQYIEAELPEEGYDTLLSELRRTGSVQVLNASGKQETPPPRNSKQPPESVLLQIRFQ